MQEDTAAFEAFARRLMQQHGDAITRLCFLYLGNEMDAQDAAQETFLKALRGYHRFRGESSERIWREEGLKLSHKQPRKRRLFLNDGSCVRLRPERRNHIWSYDFVEDSTMDGRKLQFLNIIDEHTRECLANIPRRSWRGTDVMEALEDIMLERGFPEYIRSDNGPEYIAKKLRSWLSNLGVIITYIEPGSPWENGY